jgi:RNA polymerase sigma factor (TIGR02999 family)
LQYMARSSPQSRHRFVTVRLGDGGCGRSKVIRLGEVTVLLKRLQSGERAAFDRLVELVYPELRKVAQKHFRREGSGHLLQPTALVNEAYLRLFRHERHQWQNRAHFFGAVSHAMRRILVDHARAHAALKRSPSEGGIPQGSEVLTDDGVVDLLALDEALDALEKLSPRPARIVQLRYFGGLSVPEVAETLGITSRTVDRDWAVARAWLRRRLTS